jgi:hypothetical protein
LPPAISLSAALAWRRARSNVGVMKARVCASSRSNALDQRLGQLHRRELSAP